ncbi:hypothetical protein IFM89_011458 [Coptis chinensis]|uniref:P-loop containing nucleoside triphosphate hydrolases superfamily protein n=1 Tax=Coptis chinensis TaxID=261450 RepID=A0A835IV86_9MAGN|nr:hypothetical protein IFM89_011458 [Coptis chinensis]
MLKWVVKQGEEDVVKKLGMLMQNGGGVSSKKKMKKKGNVHKTDLSDVVFSWTLDDIFNQQLYKDKVEKIPETFSSVSHYFKSFIYPIIEETHADMFSSMMLLFQAPICEILYVKIGKHDKDLLYDIKIETRRDEKDKRDVYEPQKGDVIALSDVRPMCVDDLNRPPRFYVSGLVVRGVDDDSPNMLQILTSKPISFKERKENGETLFATFLINITTNNRIWRALQGENEHNMIKEVLNADSKVGEWCDVCSFQEIHVLRQDLNVKFRSMNLNESQMDAVLSSIETRQCKHRNSIRLIWGPPGTGKTKTVATLLWALLRMKCRTLTCAPTNIAVVEVASRLLKLVRDSFRRDLYGLGDVVLFGHKERMKIDDNDYLLVIFLDYRVDRLAECFAPVTGWRHRVDSMISLFEDPSKEYDLYLEETKRKKEEQDDQKEKKKRVRQKETGKQGKIEEQFIKSTGSEGEVDKTKENNKGRDDHKERKKHVRQKGERKQGEIEVESSKSILSEGKVDETTETILTFSEFIRKQFRCIARDLKYSICNLCAHLPTSVMPIRVVKKMTRILMLLKSLKASLCSNKFCNQELEKIFISSEDPTYTSSRSSVTLLTNDTKECLQLLKSIRGELSLPDYCDKSLITRFCLQNTCLVFCTASRSAILDDIRSFETLVIDEAAQLKECESAIPLQVSCATHAILVGDERQLPAMVKSKIAEEAGLGRSLFERLVLLGQRKHLLSIQYRMHPSISLFPNSEFYGNQISDAPNVRDEKYKKRLLQGNMYGSYSFINVSHGMDEFDDGHSRRNMAEVAVVSAIVRRLYQASVDSGQTISVGVISPYKAQVFALQEKIGNRFGGQSNFSVRVRSVDGFQGGEEDVIIISTVRSNRNGSVGFLSNCQRTNVALTRARYCLWILGNAPTLLNSGSVWKKLVLDAKDRGCYFNVDEDETLSKMLLDSMVDIEELDDLLNKNNILFRTARWKVMFSDEFWKSLGRIKNVETRKEVACLLMKLSSGWRHPQQRKRTLTVMDRASSQLLEQYKVHGLLNLLWTVDVMMQGSTIIQVLMFWDILPSSEIPKLAKCLDIIFGRKLEVPMSWDIIPDAVKLDNIHNIERDQLSTEFASLRMKEDPRRPARGSR